MLDETIWRMSDNLKAEYNFAGENVNNCAVNVWQYANASVQFKGNLEIKIHFPFTIDQPTGQRPTEEIFICFTNFNYSD